MTTAQPRLTPPQTAQPMRPGSVMSEAWRNIRTGTTRAALYVSVVLFAIGGLAAADIRSMVSVVDGAHDFRRAGASVQVLEASQGIDGARCEALAEIDGITAAGAVRSGTPLRALNLPAARLDVFEVTPGLPRVLDASATNGAGIWLASELATTLGASRGDQVATDAGAASIAGVYPYPDDGRNRTLGYAVLAPTAVSGVFDACWAEVWPVNETTAVYLRTALAVGVGSEQNAVQGQLNPKPGSSYDAAALMADRITRHATAGAVVVGILIGFVAVRTRRLELTSALHARVPRDALRWELLLETLAWVLSATVVAGSALWWVAAWGNPDPAYDVWAIGMRTVAAGGLGALVGAQAALLATRERHLFRYFKNR